MIFVLAHVALGIMFMPHEEKSFVLWMRTNSQFYTGDEYFLRFGIYLANSRIVEEHNKKGTFKISLNKFAAYTTSEVNAMLGIRIDNHERITKIGKSTKIEQVPESIDWRQKGVVAEVKDQGLCASCWSFCVVAAVESIYAIGTSQLISMSEQNLIDCCFDCFGCQGGYVLKTFEFVINEQGGKLSRESEYPYAAVEAYCKFDEKRAVGGINSLISIERDSESDLMAKIGLNGPAAVQIDASSSYFHLYSSGIYDYKTCSARSINHGVACVGYGSENEVDYWILKNSWGEAWGEKGYIRLFRGINLCGVASLSYVPQI